MSVSDSFVCRPDAPEMWVCSRCGYAYRPAEGEPATGTPAGMPFELLPEDWRCPNCGSDKDYFFN